MVPLCVSTFLNQHPGHQVTVEELSADAIAQGIVNAELDLAVSYQPAETASCGPILAMS